MAKRSIGWKKLAMNNTESKRAIGHEIRGLLNFKNSKGELSSGKTFHFATRYP